MPGFQGFFEPELEQDTANGDHEQIAYVGCVHGGDERLKHQLTQLAESRPPNHLIFMGDLTGSPEMEELKHRFYEVIFNRTHTPRDGYLSLLRYQLHLEGFEDGEIEDRIRRLSDDEITIKIQELRGYPYYGNWVSSLSHAVRMAVLNTLETSAQHLLPDIDKLREQGTKVTAIGGNWDSKKFSGVLPIAGRDIVPFDTMRFFREHSLRCIDELDVLETDSVFHILLPYDVLLELEQIQETHLRDIEKRVAEARSGGKAIIMAGHAEANWSVHTLPLGNLAPIQPDRIRSIGNFGKLMARFRPDQVIYPHQHERIVDEMRREVSLNAKYVLELNELGDNVDLVENSTGIGTRPNQILVTYVPLRHIAIGTFSKRMEQNPFDRSQRPICVLNR